MCSDAQRMHRKEVVVGRKCNELQGGYCVSIGISQGGKRNKKINRTSGTTSNNKLTYSSNSGASVQRMQNVAQQKSQNMMTKMERKKEDREETADVSIPIARDEIPKDIAQLEKDRN